MECFLGMIATTFALGEIIPKSCLFKKEILDLKLKFEELGVKGPISNHQMKILAKSVFKSRGFIKNHDVVHDIGNFVMSIFTQFPEMFDVDTKLEIMSNLSHTFDGNSRTIINVLEFIGVSNHTIVNKFQDELIQNMIDNINLKRETERDEAARLVSLYLSHQVTSSRRLNL